MPTWVKIALPSLTGRAVTLGCFRSPQCSSAISPSGDLASFDPVTGILYVQSQTTPTGRAVIKPDASRVEFRYFISFEMITGPRGLPLVKPPYHRITAIDLNRGEHAWQIAFGDGPKDHPAIKDLDLGPLGSQFQLGVIAEGGLLLTKTLLITFLPDLDELGSRVAKGSLLQAYDKANGRLLHSLKVEKTLHGSPMTFMYQGRQLILIAAGGRNEPSELVAFGLPEPEERSSAAR